MTKNYIDGLTKHYGVVKSGGSAGKEKWIDSKLKIEDINVGDRFLNNATGRLSTVTAKTATSVEVYNLANWKSRDDQGNVKGVDSKNWYDMDSFNRKYIKVDDIVQYKLDKLLEWSTKRQESNKFRALYVKFEHYI